MPAKGKQPLTADELDELVDKLRARASMLGHLSRGLRDRGEPQIEVMNLPMVQRGLDGIDAFIRSIKKAVGEV